MDTSQLLLRNEDLEPLRPQATKPLHAAIERADAVLFATPEYDRSDSPVLKNAIDRGSRPEGRNRWVQEPVALVGCSHDALAAFAAVHHLRQVLTYLDRHPLQQPEF